MRYEQKPANYTAEYTSFDKRMLAATLCVVLVLFSGALAFALENSPLMR